MRSIKLEKVTGRIPLLASGVLSGYALSQWIKRESER
jgi:hypothetical protein